jgi:hypothetical protein
LEVVWVLNCSQNAFRKREGPELDLRG